MDKSYIFMLSALAAAIAFFLIVPKNQYKRFLLYGLVFGGMLDVVSIVSLTWVHQIRFMNMGHYGIFGMFPAWVPVTWMFAFAVFFYLLPRRMSFLIPYLLAFTALSYGVGLILQSYGLFEYIGNQKYWAVPIFLGWYSFSAWAYYREVPGGMKARQPASKPLPEKENEDKI